jgi:hypothetical protein
MTPRLGAVIVLAALASVPAARPARAQDMEPRAYSNSPTGANFLVLGYARSTGEVLFDATLPLTDVNADLNAGILGLGRTAERSASLDGSRCSPRRCRTRGVISKGASSRTRAV